MAHYAQLITFKSKLKYYNFRFITSICIAMKCFKWTIVLMTMVTYSCNNFETNSVDELSNKSNTNFPFIEIIRNNEDEINALTDTQKLPDSGDYFKVWSIGNFEPQSVYLLHKKDGISWVLNQYLYWQEEIDASVKQKSQLTSNQYINIDSSFEKRFFVDSITVSTVMLKITINDLYMQSFYEEIGKGFDLEKFKHELQSTTCGEVLVIEFQLDSKYSVFYSINDTAYAHKVMSVYLENISDDIGLKSTLIINKYNPYGPQLE